LIIKFLGTGTSQGIPVIACNCPVCCSADERDRRLRTSLHIEHEGVSVIIDAGPDFRQQVLRERIVSLDAILFTHQHRDHIAGLDDVRAFNFHQKRGMPVYGNRNVVDQLKKDFHYAFDRNYPGVPQLEVHEISGEDFTIDILRVTPVEVMHHRLPVYGFRFGEFTYITDAKTIPDEAMDKIAGSRVLVLNALQRADHLSHLTLKEALVIIERVQPEKAYLTHISHHLGLHSSVSSELPPGVHLAFDGMKLEV
jgi:phosphoribosyl 1,2-cyclic phosphate phosphodiesterase